MAKKEVLLDAPVRAKAIPPVNPHWVRERIAAQDARKEANRSGSSKPLPR